MKSTMKKDKEVERALLQMQGRFFREMQEKTQADVFVVASKALEIVVRERLIWMIPTMEIGERQRNKILNSLDEDYLETLFERFKPLWSKEIEGLDDILLFLIQTS